MAITLQNLQNLSNVTSLSEVHLSSEGQVEAHGGLKSAFQKIGDFFKSLTASGRAEIASRNERLLFAMQGVVEASRNSQHEQERALTGSLNTVLNRLTEAAAHHRQKSVDDLLSSLRSERQFKALPEAARQQLEIAASSITSNLPRSSWQGALNAMKVRFYGPHNTEQMMDHLRNHHVGQFSDVKEWQQINGVKRTAIIPWDGAETAISQLFSNTEESTIDQVKGELSRIVRVTFSNRVQNGVDNSAGERLPYTLQEAAREIRARVDDIFRATPRLSGTNPFDDAEARTIVNGILDKLLSDEAIQQAVTNANFLRGINEIYIKDAVRGCVDSINGEVMGTGKTVATYINSLRNALGAEHARYLPFITTMLSQSGIEATALDLQKGCGFREADILANALFADIKNRVNTVERDGNDLILRHSSRANYITQNGARAPIFHADAVLTMRIHLDQPPSTVEHPNGTAYIPSFSYEDVSLTYSAL